MTSQRKIAANRANARNSTGPRTAQGKARSAANARRHGLTAAPDADAVVAWYRVILDDPTAIPDPLELDPCRRAARDLAEAEAQLERVRRAEEAFLRNPEGDLSEGEKQLIEDRRMIRNELAEVASERKHLGGSKSPFWKAYLQTPRKYRSWVSAGERLLFRLRKAEERAAGSRLKERQKLGRTLARYRASAEARRHKALRRFAEEITKQSQTG